MTRKYRSKIGQGVSGSRGEAHFGERHATLRGGTATTRTFTRRSPG